VKTEIASRRNLAAWVRAPGTLEAVTQVQMSSNVPGRVEKIHVNEGEWTEVGRPLLDLDDLKYRSSVKQYEAQLEAARSLLQQRDSELRLAKSDLERKKDLLDKGLVSPEAFDEAESTHEVRRAASDVQAREIDRLNAALEAARRDLEETHLVAPVTGLVTRIYVEVGENVVTGTMNNAGTVILEMADLSEMEVEAEVDETDIIHVALDQPARVEVDAFQGRPLTGRVSRVGQAGRTSQEGADFLVRVRLDESPPRLRPGMTADVEILVATADSALAVPLQALTVRPRSKITDWAAEGGSPADSVPVAREEPGALDRWLDGAGDPDEDLIEGVFLLMEGHARYRPVETGLRGETYIQILRGVEAGETVITGPYRVLRTLEGGAAVRPEKAEGDGGTDAT